MFTWKRTLAAASPLLLALLAPVLPAAEKINLDRTTPVPDNEPIPIQDFFRALILRTPKLNPSGTHIAAIINPAIDHTELMVYDLKTQAIERVGAPTGDYDIYWTEWLNDKRLLYTVGFNKWLTEGLYAANIGALQGAYPLVLRGGPELVAVPPNNRTHPLFRIGPQSSITGEFGEVIRFNTDNRHNNFTKDYPILKSKDGFEVKYLADKDGNLEFGFTSNHGVLSLHRLEGDHWEKCPEDLEEMDVIDAGDNPGEIIVLGPRADGKPRPLQVVEAATGKVLDVLWQDKTYDFNGWLYRDPASHNIVGAFTDRGGPQVIWFTQAYRDLQKAIDKLFPGQVVRIFGTNEAGTVVLISTFSDRQPAKYSWVDLEKHSANLIKTSAPWLDPKRMQSMSAIKYKTRDGHQLDAYVTMPAGASKENPPPLVVLPHGSQFERSTWEFNSEVQFLASRGYAVLQPNYRGSAGYSWMFSKEEEWAFRKMSDDVTDATKAMIASGLVDSKRIAIFGTGFGGYLAFSGAAFEPGLYACVAGISPVLDWAKVLQDQKTFQFSSAYYSRMILKLGDPKSEPDKFAAMSPMRHADQIRIPVLIGNGEYDLTVELNDAKDLASSVRRKDISAEVVTYSSETDSIEHLGHKIDFYTRLEAFLAKNLKR